jgi:large subunit ribosomal protein L21
VYAVIRTGGKQEKVSEGSRLDVERLGVDVGAEVTFTPLLVVDGDTVVSTPDELSGASVTATVVGETKGPKIRGFTYKHKTRSRRRWGHRQGYATIEVTGISRGS